MKSGIKIVTQEYKCTHTHIFLISDYRVNEQKIHSITAAIFIHHPCGFSRLWTSFADITSSMASPLKKKIKNLKKKLRNVS